MGSYTATLQCPGSLKLGAGKVVVRGRHSNFPPVPLTQKSSSPGQPPFPRFPPSFPQVDFPFFPSATEKRETRARNKRVVDFMLKGFVS